MSRAYKAADVVEEGGGFVLRLDGRAAQTPARRSLRMPTARLAALVAEEWLAQGARIMPATMPVTRLATTAIDLMPTRRDDAVAEAAGYAATDLLCYRAAEPPDLVLRQQHLWQPWLDWAARHYAAALEVTVAVGPVAQPAAAVRRLRDAVARLDSWRLVGVHATTTLTGSLVLGLAMERGAIDADTAFTTGFLDELFEVERWGEDDEQQRRHATLRRDLTAATRFLRALEPAGIGPSF